MENIKEIIDIFKNKNFDEMGIYKKVSILVPLVKIDSKIHILYEVRSSKLKTQPGEICFPGGHSELNETPLETAIRETSEELGISEDRISNIEKIGRFHTYHSLDMYCYIGEIKKEDLDKAMPNADEVGEIFTVPIDYLIEAEPELYNLEVEPKLDDSLNLETLGYKDGYNWRKGYWEIPIYRYKNFIIWGLTAKITKNILEIIKNKD